MKTKEQEALHAYETLQAQEAQLAAVREQDDEERAVEASYSPFVQASDNSADTGDGRADSYGGYLGEDGCYYDRFGGHYDDYGYESRDGSYTSLTGSHYDATTGNITQADGTERAVPKDLQGKPDKKAIVKAEAAVVALDNRKEPNARPMTAEQKAAAAATEAGALGDTPQLPQANEEQQQVADQAVRIRKRKGKRLDATWTREELEAARAEVDAERKAHTKEYDDYEAVLAGKKDKPASDDERYQPVSKDQALSKIGHVHSLGTQTTTPPADPAASATEWYTDKNGGYWDEFGGYYDNKGGYWDTNGGYWDKNGGYTDKHDGYTWADGSYLDARNNYVDSGGNLWAADGTYYKAQPNIDYKAQLQEAERNAVGPAQRRDRRHVPTDRCARSSQCRARSPNSAGRSLPYADIFLLHAQ